MEQSSGLDDVVGLLLRGDGFGKAAGLAVAVDLQDQLGHEVVRRADAAVRADLQAEGQGLVLAVVEHLLGAEAGQQPLHRVEVRVGELEARRCSAVSAATPD